MTKGLFSKWAVALSLLVFLSVGCVSTDINTSTRTAVLNTRDALGIANEIIMDGSDCLQVDESTINQLEFLLQDIDDYIVESE